MVPAITDVARIAAMPDPALRNREITACYHQLSSALSASFGPVANWCTFATWASRQAGVTIRGDDLRTALQQRLASAPAVATAISQLAALAQLYHPTEARALAAMVRELMQRPPALERAAAAVARGNLKVFAEIGHEFARFLAELPDSRTRTPENVQRFVAALRAGDPPDGQQLLRDAFSAYVDAAAATHEKQRSQLVLYANLLVGLHEQTRLQPEIRAALDAVRDDLAGLRPRLVRRLLPSWWLRLRRVLARLRGRPLPLDVGIDRLIDQLCAELREVITAELMTLDLPTGTLRLGRTQPPAFPPSLQQLDYPPLLALVARPEFGPAVPRADERDWSDFSYRMHFIARLFRSHQESAELLQAPAS
jgi:hypothetical protein